MNQTLKAEQNNEAVQSYAPEDALSHEDTERYVIYIQFREVEKQQ
jgi:hypothetical protein